VVSAVAIKSDSTLLTDPIRCTDEIAAAEHVERVENFGDDSDFSGAKSAPCPYFVRMRGITPHRFRSGSLKFTQRLYLEAPEFESQSITDGGGTSAIAIAGDGKLVDQDTGQAATSQSVFGLTGEVDDCSSGLIGRTTVPGVVKFAKPSISVSVVGGEVVSATFGSEGDLRHYTTNFGSPSTFFDVIVHDGGGTGAEIEIVPPATASEQFTAIVTKPGSGYAQPPSVDVVPKLDTGLKNVEPIFGWEYCRDEEDWPAWAAVMSSSSTCVAEYATGSTDGGYVSLMNGSVPITDDGVYPFFRDGFVSYAYMMNSGVKTGNFFGPAFIKHFTEDPDVTVAESDCDTPAQVEVSVVSWSGTFDSSGPTFIAARDEIA
jgi:hypothetical protein